MSSIRTLANACTQRGGSGIAVAVANHSVEPMIGIAPEPTDGVTYLAMNAGEQASQTLWFR